MNTKRTSKYWPKLIRNMIRIHRLNNYGWGCFSGIIYEKDRSGFWIKRSNWIYNFINHGTLFSGRKSNG